MEFQGGGGMHSDPSMNLAPSTFNYHITPLAWLLSLFGYLPLNLITALYIQDRLSKITCGRNQIGLLQNQLCDNWIYQNKSFSEERRIYYFICPNKCYHELSPPTLQSIFSKNVHRYQLRNKMTYKLPKPNTDFLKKSISFQAVSLWNGLSLELKISRTFKEFKKSVKALKL
jgi:hypothetical protein